MDHKQLIKLNKIITLGWGKGRLQFTTFTNIIVFIAGLEPRPPDCESHGLNIKYFTIRRRDGGENVV